MGFRIQVLLGNACHLLPFVVLFLPTTWTPLVVLSALVHQTPSSSYPLDVLILNTSLIVDLWLEEHHLPSNMAMQASQIFDEHFQALKQNIQLNCSLVKLCGAILHVLFLPLPEIELAYPLLLHVFNGVEL
jgi:hypothetical protein